MRTPARAVSRPHQRTSAAQWKKQWHGQAAKVHGPQSLGCRGQHERGYEGENWVLVSPPRHGQRSSRQRLVSPKPSMVSALQQVLSKYSRKGGKERRSLASGAQNQTIWVVTIVTTSLPFPWWEYFHQSHTQGLLLCGGLGASQVRLIQGDQRSQS